LQCSKKLVHPLQRQHNEHKDGVSIGSVAQSRTWELHRANDPHRAKIQSSIQRRPMIPTVRRFSRRLNQLNQFHRTNSTATTKLKPLSTMEKLKLFAVGVGAAAFQGTVGVGHGVITNYGARSILHRFPTSVAVGTGTFAFLGTGTAMLAYFISTSVSTPNNGISLLNEETVYTAVCLGVPGTIFTPIGVLVGKRLPNHILTGVIGAVFCIVSPLILHSAWNNSQNKEEQLCPGLTNDDDDDDDDNDNDNDNDDNDSTITLERLQLGTSRLYKLLHTVPGQIREEDPWKTSMHFAMGMFGGLLYGVAGVGPVLMTYLTVATPFVHAQCVAAAMLSHYPRVLVGMATHVKLGNVAWSAVPALLIGTTLGGYYGGTFLTTIPEAPLKGVFGAIVGVLGARQVYSVWRRMNRLKK
jgi:uncharacterized membrane protein YfcA